MSDLGSIATGHSRTGHMTSQSQISLGKDNPDGEITRQDKGLGNQGKPSSKTTDERTKKSMSVETSPVLDARTPVTVVGSDSSLIGASKV